MISLDDIRAVSRIDRSGMLRLIDSFPDHCRKGWKTGEAWAKEAGYEWPAGLVVAGMGGSAVAGDLVKGLLQDRLPVPFALVRDYSLPAWVRPETLVICSSYSGNTEETLSSFSHALETGSRVLVITSGGELGRRATEEGLATLVLPRGLPPRAALGYSLFGLLALVDGWDFFPSLESEVGEALGVLEKGRSLWRASVPTRANKAKKMAAELAFALPLIYAQEGAPQAAAFRWKSQLNENGKMMAYNCALPELNHNEIVGLEKPFGASRPIALFLRDRYETKRMKDRVETTEGLLADAGLEFMEVWSRGRGAVARMVSLVYAGDYVSAYAGILRGFDPTPVDVITVLKKELARRHSL